jgi:hypothetical protein
MRTHESDCDIGPLRQWKRPAGAFRPIRGPFVVEGVFEGVQASWQLGKGNRGRSTLDTSTGALRSHRLTSFGLAG